MSDRANDYFSFMSDKWEQKAGKPSCPPRTFQHPRPSDDVIEFVEEPQIEVTESIVSDSMIQRIFKVYKAAG